MDVDALWRGCRWLVETEDGLRLPATLAMLLFDSSGVDKEATLTEHRELGVGERRGPAVRGRADDGLGRRDWLLFDWVMAHRESADSGAVEITSANLPDAAMIVRAVSASASVRARFDLGLLDLPA